MNLTHLVGWLEKIKLTLEGSLEENKVQKETETVIKLLYRKIKRLKMNPGAKEYGVSKKRILIQTFIQFIYLGGLLIYTIFLFTNEEEIFKGPFYQFKYIMAVITCFMFVYYFFSKVFEKYFIKKKIEKFN